MSSAAHCNPSTLRYNKIMKIVIKKSVASLGVVGDTREVKGGYAMNWLIPSGLAVQYGTSEAKEILQEKMLQHQKVEKVPKPVAKVKKSVKRSEIKTHKDDKKIKQIRK